MENQDQELREEISEGVKAKNWKGLRPRIGKDQGQELVAGEET